MRVRMLFRVTSRRGVVLHVLGKFDQKDFRSFIQRVRGRGHSVIRCAYPEY